LDGATRFLPADILVSPVHVQRADRRVTVTFSL
jgi:hypothetical protein